MEIRKDPSVERTINKFQRISENEKWQAVVNCMKNYDGMFFYGVRTTMIFCRPSCKAKTPLRDNVVFFNDAAGAMKAEFRPCKKCCPDKETYEPDLELVNKAKTLFTESYQNAVDFPRVSKHLGISINHLSRIFKQIEGITPSQYITGLRLDKAVELIEQTRMDTLEIAYMSGFKSLSGFYKSFREKTGLTPGIYRKIQR